MGDSLSDMGELGGNLFLFVFKVFSFFLFLVFFVFLVWGFPERFGGAGREVDFVCV